MAEISVDQAARRDFLTVNEVASMLNLKPRAVWRLIANGELPSFKFAERRFVHRFVLDMALYLAKAGDPDPLKTVREELAAKYPRHVDGSLPDYVGAHADS